MLGENLKYYRLLKGLNVRELANKIGVSAMEISNYENNKRRPTLENLRKLSGVLGFDIAGISSFSANEPKIDFNEFRKQSKLNKGNIFLLENQITNLLTRYWETINLVGKEACLPRSVQPHSLKFSDDFESMASSLRTWIGFGQFGPIVNLIQILENAGIIVVRIDFNSDLFSGINGNVNGTPYIVINKKGIGERQRFTLAHELAHLAFDFSAIASDKEKEKIANKVASAFLMPKTDIVRELGIERKAFGDDVFIVAKEYGVSVNALVYRLRDLGIISEETYLRFEQYASSTGFKKNEPTQMDKAETSELFEQLVIRLVSENDITASKGAELLGAKLSDVYKKAFVFQDR
jgi:Zn-dependent peptidase ImmA (M78 family)/transcriptional regulator with XRE-family HTH domain